MNKRVKVYFFILVILMINGQEVDAYTYYSGSLIEETTYTVFNLYLLDGFHYLIIENAGFISGDITREDSQISFSVSFFEGDSDPHTDNQLIPSGYYYVNCFSIDTVIGGANLAFEISATNPVSLFVTDAQGHSEFENEVSQFSLPSIDSNGLPYYVYIIVGIFGVVILVVIGINISKRNNKKKIQRLKFQSGQPYQPYQPYQQPQQRIERVSVVYVCDNCGNNIETNSRFCQSCGMKLKNQT